MLSGCHTWYILNYTLEMAIPSHAFIVKPGPWEQAVLTATAKRLVNVGADYRLADLRGRPDLEMAAPWRTLAHRP